MPMFKSFDTETTGLYPYQGDRMFSYSIGSDDGSTEVYFLDKPGSKKKLKEFWADTSITKILHHAKFDMIMVMMEGILIPETTVFHDTLLMSQILRNLAPSHALDYLCWELCGYTREIDKKIKKLGNVYGGYQNIPRPFMTKYQGADAERTMLLHETFYPHIKKDPLVHADYLNEIELVKTTIRLEQQGININKRKCLELINWMEDELDTVQDDVYELLGEFVNLSSGLKVANVLYSILRLPVLKTTPSGQASTDKETLAKLRIRYPHPIHDLILKQRSYKIGVTTIKKYIHLAGESGIIHPTGNTNKAKTGRESFENPSLQNVSKKEALLNPFPVPSRKVFIPPPGHVLYLVDYSGIEMRLIILQSGEEEMILVVNNNGDVHTMATEVLMNPIFSQTSDPARRKVLRSAGKNANFAVPYGAGQGKLVVTLGIEQLGISKELFKENFKEYQNRWPKIAFFTQDIIKRVRKDGYVTTPFGRRLYIPKDKLYSGANYLIQGTAAGILKRAQVRVDKYLKENWNDEIRIVLPIHDELIIAFPINLLKYKDRILREISLIMIDMPEINIRLDVEWRVTTKTWNDAKEIKVRY